VDDDRIDDCAVRDAHRLLLQMQVHVPASPAQPVLLQLSAAPVARLGIMGLDQRAQAPATAPLVHFFQKRRPPHLLRVPLKACRHGQCPLLVERFHLAAL
jgi:hypothetical protein